MDTWPRGGEILPVHIHRGCGLYPGGMDAYWLGTQQNTRHCAIVGPMSGQRLRRWLNIEPTMVQCLLFAEQEPPPVATR